MAKAAPSSKKSEALQVVRRCVRADDELLLDVQEATAELSPIKEEVLELEYRECCENARHAKRLRAMMVCFWVAFCGLLFLATAVSLTTIASVPTQAWVLVMLISITGVAVTYFVQDMEIRERGYYREWCQRCRIIEARMGLAGQYWRTYEKLVVPAENILQLRSLIRIYHFGIVLWIAMFILSFLALMPFSPDPLPL